MDTGFHPSGTAEKCNFTSPDQSVAIFRSPSFQAVTPQDESSLRYFFSVCGESKNPVEILEKNWSTTLAAFEEDKIMIEAQQKIINSDPQATLAATIHDRSSIYFRRLVEQASQG